MARSFSSQAIVLKTHDIGEADRFCILFTEDRGRIAARARGVRKPKSHMGGVLLSGQHVSIVCSESSGGYYIQSATLVTESDSKNDLLQFGRSQYGLELLLTLLHDEEPLPDIFSLTQEFLDRCRKEAESPVLSFTVKLLTQLGLFPYSESELMNRLSEDEKVFSKNCDTAWPTAPVSSKRLTALCMELLEDHAGKSLKTPALVPVMLS